jgi:hypothetical protein
MGFDVSYHPFPSHLVDGYFVPHMLGQREFPAAMRAAAKQRAAVLYRANAWGLGCASLMREDDALASATGFDTQTHVWGRPFFIAETQPHDVTRCVDEFIACKTDADVDAMAKAQLELLQAGLSARVAPSLRDAPPSDEQVEAMVFEKADVLRDAAAALKKGVGFILPNGQERDPARVIADNLAYVALEFGAHFQPGWMDRGQVTPSMILSQIGYEKAVNRFFHSPAMLFAGISKALPGVEFELPNTIESNYALGGCVPYDHIEGLMHFLFETPQVRANIEAMLRDEHGLDEPIVTMRKWREALLDAYARELPFLEATEIYSGFEGRMN